MVKFFYNHLNIFFVGVIMKRVFSLLLTLIIVFGALTSVPVTASAAKEQVNKAIIFRLSEDKKSYSVVDCVEAVEGEIVVPATYKGKPVIAIDDWAFFGCRNMTSLIISEGVVSVGENAFLDCDSLSSITIPGTLADIHETFIRNFGGLSEINIGENNPQYSSVDGVLFNSDKTVLIHYPYGKTDSEYTIPDGVKTISAGAFSGCWRLKSVVVGDDVTTIGENAFRGCNYLTSITIPESVTSIKNKAFYECGKFSVLYSGSENAWKEITIEDGNSRLISATKHYNSTSHSYGDLLTEKPTCNKDGYEYYECSVCGIHNITKTIPASGHVSAGVNCEICGEQILDYTIYGDEVTIIKCNGIVKELVIPGTVEGLPVTSINDEAFCWGYIKSVEVPESVTYIGWRAFYSCSDLEEINVAEGNPVY